ncbi:MAG: glutamate racemase [Clostridia bacterium]|nr:glutamate racemase [Clostridia bacterium]
MDNRPIGIFDSGLGGLTVLQEFIKQMPNEDYIYFGDNARVPYGSKSKETIIEYSSQIVKFLISQNVKMIVIACGTASANAFDTLQAEFNIPIKTVIEPTAKAIKDKNIGVIATKATINSQAWENAIYKYNSECQIYSKACPLFVPIVEEGLTNTEISKLTIQMYLSEFIDKNIDNLILGCTHYPILANELRSFLPDNIKITNVNVYSALDTKDFLEENNMLNFSRKLPEVFAYTTDNVESFESAAKTFCDIDFHKIEKTILN